MSRFKLPAPTLTAPGVILQDIAPTPREGLMTGVPVFVGGTQAQSDSHGRLDQQQLDYLASPKKLTLWPEFLQQFAEFPLSSYLTQALRGFFENGGRLCYVLLLPQESEQEPLFSLNTATLGHGLEILESLTTIDLICIPDLMQTPSGTEIIHLQSLVLEHCDRMGDRFAILDSINTTNLEEINQQRQQLIGNNGAIYAPWIQVETVAHYIPPCGHIAGIYAQNDRESGVHRAPANYVLNGVLDLSLLFRDQDWQYLNLDYGPGVNCIRSFRNRGIRVWGARSLSQIPGWQYVNVRRLMITLLRWAEYNLGGIIFEPNDTTLWTRVTRELTVYCESLWEQGALQGNEPEEAFYVKCDEETNPPDIRNAGQVLVEIGLSPNTPAEFIVISLIHGNGGVSFA
ncbi:phage tail sheath family protein [Spirulina subsalsa]|uniref:phage tail sheath family protein n=1 Tax=Spirulina subsalsa TaxID=54311 RepID=UPI0003042B74|nr:phage tail sheath subtilisin-like domain-containing protein [Spirulina subsalsa]